MTREEAKAFLESVFHGLSTKMQLAIKALEQEPCDNAISRQEAVEAFQIFREYESNRSNKEWVDRIETVLNQLPPVNLQPKTGHWEVQPSNKEMGERDFIWWKCSECGQVMYSETEKDRREFHAFCGRCGAKMIEPQERSDK